MTTINASTLLDALNWRYATKKFDSNRKIDAATWTTLEHSLVQTPSSFGLQPWKFLIVTDPVVKAKLSAASWGQTQPADCSHHVVFTFHEDLDIAHIDRHLARMVEVRGVAAAVPAQAFGNVVKNSIEGARQAGKLDAWQSRQAYIALGQFMAAAALLAVDTCPMEGIVHTQYDEILGLLHTPYRTVVACAAGYRAADDKYAALPKVRFKSEEVIVRI